MALAGSFRVVQHEGQRFLCFCSENPVPRLHVTNACEFWSCDVALDKLDRQVSQCGLNSSCDDCIVKLREAFEYQTPTLTIQDSKAILQFQDSRQTLTFDLFKVSLSEARKLAQDLVFGLVEQVQKLEKHVKEGALANAGTLPLGSPEKNTLKSQSLFSPELSPLKGRGGAGTGQAASKKRMPGESLINPGFKSKKTPSGVDFEEA
ncbi:PREDICTED: protein PAXX isoform X1 [Gekko japonicus]|uniref:Protein PAXX isoform X1 n=1 Tax=Gekko japonicus TaxID=146911 RepID=A0ABM1L7Q7_GEKJA|nr:PREDICTED: protein PAXX isoform X1 [Gekko japonicus]